MTNAERALELVSNDSVIGLGSGRAASAFVRALGERVRAGLRVRGLPTSRATADLAREVGVPVITPAAATQLDLTIDGADEVDSALNLIKGYGAALLREKIVASMSRRLVILVGPEKLVRTLGERGRVPVEVVPFAVPFCREKLAELGCRPQLRLENDQPVVTDNGNRILDCKTEPIADPGALETAMRAIPGVVGTGLFLAMADRILVQDGDAVREMCRPG